MGQEGAKKKIHVHESFILHDNADHPLAKLWTELDSDPGEIKAYICLSGLLTWSSSSISGFSDPKTYELM